MASLLSTSPRRLALGTSSMALTVARPHRVRDDEAVANASRILDELDTQISKKVRP